MWAAILILVFVVALAGQPLHGGGWFWELGNGFGFLALALLLVSLSHGRGGLGRKISHRWLGLAVLFTTIAHIAWLLIGDSITWEYLKWGTPHYMVAGLFAAGLIALLSLSSLASIRSHSYTGRSAFRSWHRWLSILIVVSTVLHISLSSFYLVYAWQVVVIVLLSVSAYLLPVITNMDLTFARRNLVVLSVLALVVLVLVRVGLNL